MNPPSEKDTPVSDPSKDGPTQNGPLPSAQIEVVDEEAQNPTADQRPSNSHSDQDEHGYRDNSNVPKLSYLKLFWFFFYNFGLFAWGGPVAQIALIKERLVIQDRWITLSRFQRVFAVYQILPGPEAAELCMFFGCLSAGRIGGLLAGLAFMLPGFILMLLASYLYTLAGFENVYFNASFKALQPIVAAMVCPYHIRDTVFTKIDYRFYVLLIRSPNILWLSSPPRKSTRFSSSQQSLHS
jgi:chromate transport protein ChrA